MNPLLKIINEFDNQFKDCKYYSDYRNAFFKLYNIFNEYYNGEDFKSKNLVYPLKMHFDSGLSKFLTIKYLNSSNEDISSFVNNSINIKNFWIDVIKDYTFITKGPNIFYVFYCYLKRFHNYIESLYEYSKQYYILENEESISIIKRIQILYCVFYSSENITTKLNDNLYMYIEDDFDKFWKIFYDLKSTNCGETIYNLEKLYKSSKNNYKSFCSKYKKIYNYYDGKKFIDDNEMFL